MKNATRIQRCVRPSISSGPGSIIPVVEGWNEAVSAAVCAFQAHIIEKD